MPAKEFDKIIEETIKSIEQLGNVHDQELLEKILRNLPDIAREISEGYYQYPIVLSIADDKSIDTVEHAHYTWTRQIVTISEKLAELHLMNNNQEAALYYLKVSLNEFSKRPIDIFLGSGDQTFKLTKISLQLFSDIKDQNLKKLEGQAKKIFKEFSNFL